MNITQAFFGKLPSGEEASLFTLDNGNGIVAKITDYGATWQSLTMPDKAGNSDDILLGFPDLSGYLQKHPFFGSLVGRYANRLGGAAFELDGQRYQLAANEPPNQLHGGWKGFDKALWKAETRQGEKEVQLILRHTSPDGDENYPGKLEVTVTYTLTAAGELILDYLATTDAPTVLNLTNHAYFNLKGEDKMDINGHEVYINAQYYTPYDEQQIPTGEILSVKGTPLDFTEPHLIEARIDADHEAIRLGEGYDHNFPIQHPYWGALSLAASVRHIENGRKMEVHTTHPAVQFYTGNHLEGDFVGKSGKPYPKRSGFCFETQHYPDSPNQPTFPSTVLRLGEEYKHRTVFKFLVEG